jgi:hypothetical protein
VEVTVQLSAQDYAEVVATLQASEAEGNEKRQFTRMQVRGRIVVTMLEGGHAAGSYTCLTRDVSMQGAGLMQTLKVQAGQSVLIYLPRKDKPAVCLVSRVMHVRTLADGLYAVGCNFIAPADQSTLRQAKVASTSEAERIRNSILS